MKKECLLLGAFQGHGNQKLNDPLEREWVEEKVKLPLFNPPSFLWMFINVTSSILVADIHHYVTPVRANRMIIELGGYLDWREASRILTRVADLLPFSARFVSQELLDMENRLDAYIAEKNVNPFYPPGKAMLKNYAGSRSFLSPWHFEWTDPSYR